MNHFYIPEDVVVGVKDDNVALSGKLGFLTFYEKNKLRKEVSFNGWRNKDYPVQKIPNKPRTGFIVNRHIDHKAYDFGNDRVRFRVFCPEDDGFEFEITPQNMSYILSVCDINRREIAEPCVFAWDKGELMLIPTNSQHYVDALGTTDVRNNFKEIKKEGSCSSNWKMGTIIKNKAGKRMIYMGKRKFTFIKSLLSSIKSFKKESWENINGKQLFAYNLKELHLVIPVPNELYRAVEGKTYIPESVFCWESINPENYIEDDTLSFDDLKSTSSLEVIKKSFETQNDVDYQSELLDFRVDSLSNDEKWYFDLIPHFIPQSYYYTGLREEALSQKKIDMCLFLMNDGDKVNPMKIVNIKGKKLDTGEYSLSITFGDDEPVSFTGSFEKLNDVYPVFKDSIQAFILKVKNHTLLTVSIN